MFELKPSIEESPAQAALRQGARFLPLLAVAALFVFVGYTKFDGDPRGPWFAVFERIGLGQWFRIATGVLQMAGGALILWRPARTLGAAMLASTMAGAVLVDLFVLRSPLAVVPMMLLFLIVAVWAAVE